MTRLGCITLTPYENVTVRGAHHCTTEGGVLTVLDEDENQLALFAATQWVHVVLKQSQEEA